MSLSSESYYETTYSQDERIELYLREKYNAENEEKEKTNREREQEYDEYFIDNINNSDSIFNNPGMYLIDFTHKKIKFCFTPSEVTNMINTNAKFYCSIKFRNNRWMIRRNSIPINCRSIIYTWYCSHVYKKISSLHDVLAVINFIYKELIIWCNRQESFRNEKRMRYLSGDEVELDSDDEQLFVIPEDVEERRRKREAILKRMIPPTQKERHYHRRLRRRF